jgi:predicted small secreted protein
LGSGEASGAPLGKVIFMCKKMMRPTLILLAFLGIAPLLAACHATAGAGKDISKTGQAITRSADSATPR